MSQFFLLLDHEDNDNLLNAPELEIIQDQVDIPQINLHAIMDKTIPRLLE